VVGRFLLYIRSVVHAEGCVRHNMRGNLPGRAIILPAGVTSLSPYFTEREFVIAGVNVGGVWAVAMLAIAAMRRVKDFIFFIQLL
jgi:hypothetical protein